jgi:hypothetical protein
METSPYGNYTGKGSNTLSSCLKSRSARNPGKTMGASDYGCAGKRIQQFVLFFKIKVCEQSCGKKMGAR